MLKCLRKSLESQSQSGSPDTLWSTPQQGQESRTHLIATFTVVTVMLRGKEGKARLAAALSCELGVFVSAQPNRLRCWRFRLHQEAR